jgi:uncharacterized protein YecE (DUF72 family)
VIRIGVSGWVYDGWQGTFYPTDLPRRAQLGYLSGRLNSIEINGTFYALQRPSSFTAWRDATPADFVFAVKGPRFITHMKRLNDPRLPLANFFASGLLALDGKLGPLLWQLPATFAFDPGRLEAFFVELPRTTAAAAQLAQEHEPRMQDRALTTAAEDRPVRHVLEVRNDTFAQPLFAGLLREHDIGLVVADSAGKWPTFVDVTAHFAYIRLHGDAELYASGYDDRALDTWAARIRTWHDQDGLDVFVYFDNDAKVHAPFDAIRLGQRLGLWTSGDTVAPESGPGRAGAGAG